MKRSHRALAVRLFLTAGLVAIAPVARAQDPSVQAQSHATSQVQAEPGSPMPDRSPEAVLERLAAKLNLRPEQKTQILPILTDRQQKLAAIRSDTSLRHFMKARKAKEVFAESDKQIKALLDDSQKQQYAELEKQMQQEMKQRAQERRAAASNGDGATRP
jgi:hypothetical protein